MSSENPERDARTEPVREAGYGLDPEEATGDPLEPVPLDGRDAQPAEGSSDDATTMAVGDPLREPVYVGEDDPDFTDAEVAELQDEGELADPAADQLANEAIDAGIGGNPDEDLAAEPGDAPDSASR